MIRSLTHRLPILLLTLGLLAPAAFAQAPQQSSEQPETVEVTDDELNRVAELLVDIEEVKEKYRARVGNSDDVDKAREVQQEMATAVEKTIDEFDELSSDRYEEIVQAAQSDLDLRENILARVEEERQRREEQTE